MKRALTWFSPAAFKVARLVGRKEYAAAIALLEGRLVDGPSDAFALQLLAECYRWSGADEKAIESATKALRYDANDFSVLQFLSELHAKRDDRTKAVEFIRRALDNYPEPLPSAPRALVGATRIFNRMLPPFRRLGPKDFADLEDPNSHRREWFNWAQAYLAWHDDLTGSNSSPIVQ